MAEFYSATIRLSDRFRGPLLLRDLQHENLRQIPGGFTDPATLEFALRGCDAVIHLASITGRAGPDGDPALVKSANLEALGPLLCAAKAAGIKRYILASP